MQPGSMLVALIAAGCCTACSAGPEDLARRFAAAAESADANALRALTDLAGAPADVHYALLSPMDDCMGEATCAASVQPLPADFGAQSTQMLAALGAAYPVQPEGVVVLEITNAEGKREGSLTAPYARVDGEYRLVSARYTPEKVAEAEAATLGSLLARTLANQSEETGVDWQVEARALPADGGEPGKALVDSVQAVAKAVATLDPDLASRHTGARGAILFGAKDWNQREIPMAQRKARLASQAPRLIVEAKVQGGRIHGDTAVLAIEGRNGAGNRVRGAVILTRTDGAWAYERAETVEIPAG